MEQKLLVTHYKSLKGTLKSKLDLSDFLNVVLTLRELILARTNFREKIFKLLKIFVRTNFRKETYFKCSQELNLPNINRKCVDIFLR